ncbi:LysR family transcriptional regulator [Vibrio sinensis]|uniref:LysR family transcriptional regulator n=1 Tax=Vibrio sinensis TaxID=2302434 RepID=A0A3A6QL83_9VIBR|nr:LysR family transcriptional regulator [Vibrio sinensis]RJX73620.1 LysR family transcriptional regulator [Vibrio sinensis]
MSLQIDTLRMFCLLADKLSFTEAADQLNISQPTLSRKISQLEQSVKLRLFHRGGSQIHLTPQGVIFRETCQRMLQELDDTVDGLHDTSDFIRGDISIGLLHPMARWLSQSFFREFCQRHPNIRLHLTTLHPSLLRGIGNSDIMISPLLPDDLSLVAKPLFKFRRIFCASPDYLDRCNRPYHPKELSTYQCITNTNAPKPELNWYWQGEDGTNGVVDVKGVMSTDSVDVATNLAMSGLGIALLPQNQVKAHISAGYLVDVFDGAFGQWGQMHAVYRSRQYLPTRFRVFMEELCEFFQRTDASAIVIWKEDKE